MQIYIIQQVDLRIFHNLEKNSSGNFFQLIIYFPSPQTVCNCLNILVGLTDINIEQILYYYFNLNQKYNLKDDYANFTSTVGRMAARKHMTQWLDLYRSSNVISCPFLYISLLLFLMLASMNLGVKD